MTPSEINFGSFGGNWSDVKLAAVREYFNRFNLALSKTSFNRVYIDAFAGGGRVKPKQEKGTTEKAITEKDLFSAKSDDNADCKLGPLDEIEETEAENFRHGSPLLALESYPPFHEFIFIERHQETLNQLKLQVSEKKLLKGRPVKYLCEDANTALERISKEDWSAKRATIFLDPFALQIRWSTLEALAGTKAMDMWMLFPAMAVNRMLPRNADVPQVWAQRLNETFGDTSWRQEFYAVPEQKAKGDLFPDFLPESKEAKLEDPFGRLSRYVTRRLKTVFADAVEKPLVLKTSSGSPLFLLCFAVANERGAPIAKRIADHIIQKQTHGL